MTDKIFLNTLSTEHKTTEYDRDSRLITVMNKINSNFKDYGGAIIQGNKKVLDASYYEFKKKNFDGGQFKMAFGDNQGSGKEELSMWEEKESGLWFNQKAYNANDTTMTIETIVDETGESIDICKWNNLYNGIHFQIIPNVNEMSKAYILDNSDISALQTQLDSLNNKLSTTLKIGDSSGINQSALTVNLVESNKKVEIKDASNNVQARMPQPILWGMDSDGIQITNEDAVYNKTTLGGFTALEIDLTACRTWIDNNIVNGNIIVDPTVTTSVVIPYGVVNALLREGLPNSNASVGVSTGIVAESSSGTVLTARSLFKDIDTINTLSPDSVFSSAVLSINQQGVYGTPWTIDVHRLTSTWINTQVTWNDRVTSTPWSVSGGDFDASIIDNTTDVIWPSGRYDFDVKSWAQDVVNGVIVNEGLMLKVNSENLPQHGIGPGFCDSTNLQSQRAYFRYIYSIVTSGSIEIFNNTITDIEQIYSWLRMVQANKLFIWNFDAVNSAWLALDTTAEVGNTNLQTIEIEPTTNGIPFELKISNREIHLRCAPGQSAQIQLIATIE